MSAIDHVSASLSRLLYQYAKAANLKAVITALAQQSQDEEDCLQNILANEVLSGAVGEQLDGWGKVMNVPRGTMGDAAYRSVIYLKIYRNFSEGTVENLLTVFKAFMSCANMELSEIFPATVSLQANAPSDPDLVNARIAMLTCKAAGIELGELSYSESPAFAFSEYSLGLISTAGFDDGTGAVGGTLSTDF